MHSYLRYNLYMPAIYSHWAFGRECIGLMPEKLQYFVNKYRDYYDLGVQGPDMFFFNLISKKTIATGKSLHNTPAKVLFKNFKKVFNKHEEKAEMLVYMSGFLTHFLLDSMCHSYVVRKSEVSNITHSLVESQWDRHLMLRDLRKPNLVDRSESIHPNANNTKIISYLYEMKHNDVYIAYKWFLYVTRALNSISPKKEKVLRNILIKHEQYFNADLFVGFEDKAICLDSNEKLNKLKQEALKKYPELINNLINYLDDEINEELTDYFDYDMSEKSDYKSIVI